MPTYARLDLAFERGEGVYLYTEDGQAFLDFAAGIAVNALGHCHPHLVQALERQSRLLWHCSNLYRIPEAERLASRLADHSFADFVFLSNSGAEAVEGAIKVARKYFHVSGEPHRNRIIACRGGFHGRTLTTLSAAGNEKYLEGFGPPSPGFDTVAFGNTNELRAAVTGETAAILIEPIQGENGINVGSTEYLRSTRQLADECGLLLILDEVQCGMGRTGKLFAYEWAGIEPDIVALAKALGGGFPIGAVLATGKAASGMTAGTHGSTFGGNPLAAAVANAVLDIMLAPGFLEDVTTKAARLSKQLERLAKAFPDVIEEVRGRGFMVGLKTKISNTEMTSALQKEGLLTVPAGNSVVRLLPPLVAEAEHIDAACGMVERACERLAGGPGG